METSPPVRDVSERDRANRNKCIVVAVVSVLVLAAIVLVIAYITHFRSTDLTPDAAGSLVDRAILGLKNDSVVICDGKYEIVLRDGNGTNLLERLGDCREVKEEADDLMEKNSTEPAVTNIICKLSASNVKIVATAESNLANPDCKVNATMEVDFELDDDDERDIEGITFRPVPKGTSTDLASGITEIVSKVLGENVLELVTDYSTTANATTTFEPQPISWPTICRRIQASEC